MGSKVLVVEDDVATCEMFRLLFGAEGYDVEVVMDGEVALQRLQGPPVDLVVLDVMIPVADGLEVLQALRACGDDVWRTTPVIMATARGNDEDVWSGWRAGADYYLVKPFDPQELQSVARRLLTADVAPA